MMQPLMTEQAGISLSIAPLEFHEWKLLQGFPQKVVYFQINVT